MDKIYFNHMQFYGYHGVFPEENKLGQRFHVDLELSLDLAPAGKSDDLNDTVNYADIFTVTQEIVERKQFKLVETLAEQIASQLLNTFHTVQEVLVRITKPDPPIAGQYDSVAVEIVRKKG